MAPTFRSATQGTGFLPNFVPTKPTGTADGDLLLVALAMYVSTTGRDVTTVPAGWTLLRAVLNTPRSCRLNVYWKIASGEPASWTFGTNEPGAFGQSWTCLAVQNPVGPGYIADHQGQLDASASTAHPAPSVTAASVDDLLVYFTSGRDAPSATPPAGFTERADMYETTSPMLVEAATKAAGAAGATGTVSATTAGVGQLENVLVAVNGLAAVTFAPPHPIWLQTSLGWASLIGPAGATGPAGSTGATGPAGPNVVNDTTPSPLTGMLKANGTDIDVAVAGTDYVTPASLTTGLGNKVDKDSVVVAATRVVRNMLAGGDTQPAFQILGDGRQSWGLGGTTAPDTNLYRSAAGTLKTDSTLSVAGNLFAAAAVFLDPGNTATKTWWGSSQDTNLYRSAGNTLRTDSTFSVGGNLFAASAVFLDPANTATKTWWGSSQDTNLYRSAGATLKTDGVLIGDHQTLVASVTTARTGGAAVALPANPVRYLALRDENGNRVYVPCYS